jgi:predicted metal-dependent hydrolase
MSTLEIFGKTYALTDQISDKDQVTLTRDEVKIERHWKPSKTLLNDFLSNLLHERLIELSEGIELEGKIGIFGKLEFEIKEKIDNKKDRIAKLKGNKILVKLNTVALPEDVLKYIIAHELAHTASKQHTPKFWKTVEVIYPNYSEAKEHLKEHKMTVDQI